MAKQIYLAGAMSGLPREVYEGWRGELSHRFQVDAPAVSGIKFKIIDPTIYIPAKIKNAGFDNLDRFDYDQKEDMRRDMWLVRTSDLVIANFSYKPDSIGTACEICLAYEHNIPVVGYVDPGRSDVVHPWLEEMCTKVYRKTELKHLPTEIMLDFFTFN